MPVAFAIGVHPDDIEFMMAGTLLQLKSRGWETHYMNVSDGNCGSLEMDSKKLGRVRTAEAKRAAKVLGAVFHPSIGHDMEVVYDLKTVRRLASVVRAVKPDVVLTHSPFDYMEDHTNTCRMVVTAVFSRNLKNFVTIPPRPHMLGDTVIYHCMPQGLSDSLRRRVIPGSWVNTTPVHEQKLAALAEHKSQQNWLDASQKMNSYMAVMVDFAQRLGKQSKKFKFAEGWRRHLHYAFSSEGSDPLKEALGSDCIINQKYERDLLRGF